ncbi:MAG: TIGR00282 family metallophosphoesterase [Gemmatimonadetes bacterium]|nr:TIGR00282 family metallophosphoesterase [Gemmatimonadota bacterium]
MTSEGALAERGALRILFIADVVGRPGRRVLRELAPRVIERERPSMVIVNAENSAGGFGVNERSASALFDAGADVLTGGNHSWDKAEGVRLIATRPRMLRPANLPPGTPGHGHGVYEVPGGKVAVVNLIGRVFMAPVDCPFRTGRKLLEELRTETPVIFVDFHAEATSEKMALGRHLDGLCSMVVGTHTHTVTADTQILPGGTAFQTDAGMTGGHDGVIGMKAEGALRRFLSGRSERLEPATGDLRLNGVLVEVNPATGRALSVKRIQERLEDHGPGREFEG